MAGPRILGPRLLRQLSTPVSASQFRSLHMTGAATAPARLPTTDKPVQAQFQEPGPVTPPSAPSKGRHFNTSRELKAVNDSSTVDFAYLPQYDTPLLSHEDISMSGIVPILPAGSSINARKTTMGDFLAKLDGPSVSTVAAESTHIHAPSAMSDVHDGAEHHTTDFHDIADTLNGVREAARMVTLGVEREVDQQTRQAKGVLKTVWTGLVDDILGARKTAS